MYDRKNLSSPHGLLKVTGEPLAGILVPLKVHFTEAHGSMLTTAERTTSLVLSGIISSIPKMLSALAKGLVVRRDSIYVGPNEEKLYDYIHI